MAQDDGYGIDFGGVSDLVSTLKGVVENLGQIDQTLGQVFPRVNGTFTLSAATATVVTNASIASNSIVIPFATNATAALVVRTNGLFVSALTSGVSFSMSTQAGSATSGGTFSYIVLNPS